MRLGKSEEKQWKEWIRKMRWRMRLFFILSCINALESHSTMVVVLKFLFSFVNAFIHVWHSCCVRACNAVALFVYFDVFVWLVSKEEKRCKLNMEIPLLPATYEVRAPPHPCVLSDIFVSQISWEKCDHAYIYAKPKIHTWWYKSWFQFSIKFYVIQYRWCSLFNQTQPTGIHLYLFTFCKNIINFFPWDYTEKKFEVGFTWKAIQFSLKFNSMFSSKGYT